jgi:glycosyltransferase involved in cell wall biosynthesis
MQIKDIEILWTHFGDGAERQALFEQMEALPLNIKVAFKGLVPNKEIYDFYKNESVDLFINLSSSEGIPVSIMEALSYGIPVIATDVGGTSELVNEENGVLVDKNIDSVKVAQKVSSIIRGDLSFDRKVIKSEFKSNFDAQKNYSEFSQYLVALLSDEGEPPNVPPCVNTVC